MVEGKKFGRNFDEKLAVCRDNVKESQMFRELCISLAPYKNEIKEVRCLAIGSFYEDQQAKYQLALLLLLVDHIACDQIAVSIYDPVFNDQDKEFIKQRGWVVEETRSQENDCSADTLFFLPHAPLDLTELVLKAERPKLWLANHIVAHTDRYTKSQLNEKYPVISKLVHVLECTQVHSSATEEEAFTTFVPKRKRKSNKNKYKYTEPDIDYTSICTHFEHCKVLTDFKQGLLLKNDFWVNSFSDLALQLIE